MGSSAEMLLLQVLAVLTRSVESATNLKFYSKQERVVPIQCSVPEVVECRAYKLTFEENPLNPNHSLFGRVTITLFDGEHVFIVRRNQVDSNSTYKTYVGHRSDNRNKKDTGIGDTDM